MILTKGVALLSHAQATVIFMLNAPWGPTFGRHQSTHAATLAVKPGGLIAIHDCEREREQTVCRVLLEGRGYNLLEEVERLRIYQAPR